MRNALGKTLVASLGYLVLAFACLIRWHGPHPLARVDWFSGTYFALRLAGSLHSILSSLDAFRSTPVREEWWALDSDPKGPRWVMLLMALDLAVFLDYGHWQFVPGLVQPALEGFGLLVYVAVMFWQVWADEYLARYFSKNETFPVPMNVGPYRYVRHPRYGAAIVGKAAVALIFGSIFGWFLMIPWAVLLLNKIEVEERHLRKFFGRAYEVYMQGTAKVIPGIY